MFELLVIVDTFATGFANLPELIPGRSDYRVMIATDDLVRGYSVVGQLDRTAQLDSSRSNWTSVPIGPHRSLTGPLTIVEIRLQHSNAGAPPAQGPAASAA